MDRPDLSHGASSYLILTRAAPIPQFHFRYQFRYSIFSIGHTEYRSDTADTKYRSDTFPNIYEITQYFKILTVFSNF